MTMNQGRSALPSERAEQKKERELLEQERAKASIVMLRNDFGATFSTVAGKRVLAWFAHRCGWGSPPLAANREGGIDETITTHNAMELSLYLAIRKYVPVEVLKQIEYGEIEPSGVITEEELKKVKRKTKKGK